MPQELTTKEKKFIIRLATNFRGSSYTDGKFTPFVQSLIDRGYLVEDGVVIKLSDAGWNVYYEHDEKVGG